ncbi:MAG TPA: BMC domain-containing protein [Syntrophomonas sp.]|nr:BMC domain-containing protein [Syntrophomonas sp.]
MAEMKQRIIQESVPGKQVTLCHMIAHCDTALVDKLGMEEESAAGIMTITPYEAVIIAADRAVKTSDVELVVVDRFTGTLLITGKVSSVGPALCEANRYLSEVLNFDSTDFTQS